MTSITVIAKETNKRLETKEITNNLESMQKQVGGLIELVRLPHGIDMWINEEGNITDLEPNFFWIRDYEMLGTIAGSTFFAGLDEEGETISLTDFQQEWIKDNVVIYDYTPQGEIYQVPHNLEETE